MTTPAKLVTTTKFALFERLTAGFCMAIPFFLLVADTAASGTGNYAWLIVPLLLTLLLPALVPVIIRQAESKYQGVWLMITSSILLFAFYLLFVKGVGLETKDSISAYVTMRDSFIFGMVLAIGAMLFLGVGFVYFEQIQQAEKLGEQWFRKYINIMLGILLLGVITFPCTTMNTLHSIFAFGFFICCAVSTVRREVSPKKSTETQKQAYKKRFIQRLADYAPVAVMLYFGAAHLFPVLWIFDRVGPVTLFGAECIALWIVGVDFILYSLKREG